jgi:hypothetical protein
MSQDSGGGYRFDYTVIAGEEIQVAADFAALAGMLSEYQAILIEAVRLMKTDPHGWGDPEYRSQYVDGVYCHGILRPVVFRYVIYEEVRGVVLLSVQLFADFE